MVEFCKEIYQTEKQVQEIAENELRSLVFALHKQIAGLLEENAGLKSRVTNLEKTMKKHDETHKRIEMDKVKHSVIIKGLPYHKDAKDVQETRRQTQENISKLLSSLEAGSEVGVTKTLRF